MSLLAFACQHRHVGVDVMIQIKLLRSIGGFVAVPFYEQGLQSAYDIIEIKSYGGNKEVT